MKFLIYGEVLEIRTLNSLVVRDLDVNKDLILNIPHADEFKEGDTSFFIGETDESGGFNVQTYDIRKFISPLFEEDLMEAGSAPFHTKPTIIQDILNANQDNGIISLKVLTEELDSSDQ